MLFRSTLQSVVNSSQQNLQAQSMIDNISNNMQEVVFKMQEITVSTGEQEKATTAMAQSSEKMNIMIGEVNSELQIARKKLNDMGIVANNLQNEFNKFKY